MNKDGYDIENLFGLNNQVIIVTGAGGQIGGEIVSACNCLGAKVIAADFDSDALLKRSTDANWCKDSVSLFTCDITKKQQVAELFSFSERAVGSVTAIVNNAGVSVFKPFLDREEEELDWVMDVNLKGTFWCIREFIERHDKGAFGRIVNIASHYGLISPDPRIYTDCERRNSEIYGATKAGIIQMTRYFSTHVAQHGINVNAVAPGGVRNPWQPQGKDFQKNYSYRTPMNRMAEVMEIPGAVTFLLSPASSYISGQTITIDGGMSAW